MEMGLWLGLDEEEKPLLFSVAEAVDVFLTWSPEPDSNRRPRPYQGRALPTELSGQTKTLAKKWKRVKKVATAVWSVNSKFAENQDSRFSPGDGPFSDP
jgi:hypothetical protein